MFKKKIEKSVLKSLRSSQEYACAEVSFLNQFQAYAQLIFFEVCIIFEKVYFAKHLWVNAFGLFPNYFWAIKISLNNLEISQ